MYYEAQALLTSQVQLKAQKKQKQQQCHLDMMAKTAL